MKNLLTILFTFIFISQLTYASQPVFSTTYDLVITKKLAHGISKQMQYDLDFKGEARLGRPLNIKFFDNQKITIQSAFIVKDAEYLKNFTISHRYYLPHEETCQLDLTAIPLEGRSITIRPKLTASQNISKECPYDALSSLYRNIGKKLKLIIHFTSKKPLFRPNPIID